MKSDAPLQQTAMPNRRKRWIFFVVGLAAIYFLIAYVIIPAATHRYYLHHPSLDDNPRITTTADGHPGDPLDVALIGTKEQVDTIMHAAKWGPAAALGLKS